MKQHSIALPFEAAGPDGVINLSFPDNGAGSGWAGFVQHIQLIAKLDPAEIAEMMSSEEGTKLLGDVEITGGKSGMDLLEDWDEAVKLEATPGRLTEEQYERYLRGESPDDQPAQHRDDAVHTFEELIVVSRKSHRYEQEG